MYYEGDVFEIETKKVESEKDIKIRETIAEISSKAKEGIGKMNMVTDKLERDPRINVEYMKHLPTFLDNMEYGIKTDSSVVKSQLLTFSNGNVDVVNEYGNDKEFMKNIDDAINARSEVNKEIRELPKLFADASYSTNESTTDYIIYKAEFGLYDISDRETFENEFSNDFADLVYKTEHDLMQGERSIDRFLEEEMGEVRFKEKENEEVSNALEHYRELLGVQSEVSDERFEEARETLLETLEMYDFQVDSNDFKTVHFKLKAGAYSIEKNEFYKEITKDLAPFIPTKEKQEASILRSELTSKLHGATADDAREVVRDIRKQIQSNVNQVIDKIESMESPDSLIENKAFRSIYEGVKGGDFTGRTEIEKTLAAVKAPKIENEILDKLVELNRDSHLMYGTLKYIQDLESKEVAMQLHEVENNFAEARDLYKNREHDLQTENLELKTKNEELKKENEQLKQEKEQKPKRSFFSLER